MKAFLLALCAGITNASPIEMMKYFWRVFSFPILLGFGVLSAQAGTIVFTEVMTGSGTLDGTAFTEQSVVLTLTGDTADITSPTPGLFILLGSSAVSVQGIGNDTFTDSIGAVANQNVPYAGMTDFTSGVGILFTRDPAFSNYALDSSIGPLTGDGACSCGFLFDTFKTVGGSFYLSGGTGSVTFTAEVPEPAPLPLLGTALGGLWVAMCRKRIEGRHAG